MCVFTFNLFISHETVQPENKNVNKNNNVCYKVCMFRAHQILFFFTLTADIVQEIQCY